MKQHIPKFEQRIAQDFNDRAMANVDRGRGGVIISYNSFKNTATVLMESSHSSETGEILTEVSCPTYMGVQTVAPEPGRPAWIQFKGKGNRHPMITNFYNHAYQRYDYDRQTSTNVNNVTSYLNF